MQCKIRKWRADDAKDLSEAFNNPKIHANLRDGLPLPYTEKDASDFIGAMLAAPEDSTYAFAITVDDKAIGSIGVFRKENIHSRTAEMGYYVAEPYWGKGITSSAVSQTVAYVFENTDMMRIFAEPFSYNMASRRVLEKNGFVSEGILRENAVKNGKTLDMVLYALLKRDYEQANKK